MKQDKPLLEIRDVSVAFGGLRAVDHVSLQVEKGDFVGLIGPNGAGKTTFFNCITGYIAPTEGKILMNGKDITGKSPAQLSHVGVSRTFQNIRVFPKMSVLDNVCAPLISTPRYSAITAMLGLPAVKKTRETTTKKALEIIEIMGLTPYLEQQAGTLAYGLQRRLEIARALAATPSLLLLDEPAAGMNNDEVDELIHLLTSIKEQFDLTIILIEHHIDMVLRLCPRIYVLNLGSILMEGTPEEVQSDERVIRAYLGGGEWNV